MAKVKNNSINFINLQNCGHSVSYAGGLHPTFADDGNGDNSGSKSFYTITFNYGGAAPGAGASDGDKLTIKGILFTFCSANNYTGADGEVLIGTTVAKTAQNFAKVFNQYVMLHPQLYSFTVDINHAATNVVTITSRNDHVSLNGTYLYEQENPNIAAIAIGSADCNAGALEIDAPTAEKFIGQCNPNFEVITANNTISGESDASDLINVYDLANQIDARNTAANRMAADAAGDGAAVLQCTVGDEIYRAAIFVAAYDETNDYYIRFESTTTDSAFVVKTAAIGVPNLAGFGNAILNSALICDSLSTLFSNHVNILQTHRIDLNTSFSKIAQENSFVTDLTVNLTSDNFYDLKFEKFKISEDPENLSQYFIIATISGIEYKSASIDPNTLISGKRISLVNPTKPGHELSINIGDKNWQELSENSVTIVQQLRGVFNIELYDLDEENDASLAISGFCREYYDEYITDVLQKLILNYTATELKSNFIEGSVDDDILLIKEVSNLVTKGMANPNLQLSYLKDLYNILIQRDIESKPTNYVFTDFDQFSPLLAIHSEITKLGITNALKMSCCLSITKEALKITNIIKEINTIVTKVIYDENFFNIESLNKLNELTVGNNMIDQEVIDNYEISVLSSYMEIIRNLILAPNALVTPIDLLNKIGGIVYKVQKIYEKQYNTSNLQNMYKSVNGWIKTPYLNLPNDLSKQNFDKLTNSELEELKDLIFIDGDKFLEQLEKEFCYDGFTE